MTRTWTQGHSIWAKGSSHGAIPPFLYVPSRLTSFELSTFSSVKQISTRNVWIRVPLEKSQMKIKWSVSASLRNKITCSYLVGWWLHHAKRRERSSFFYRSGCPTMIKLVMRCIWQLQYWTVYGWGRVCFSNSPHSYTEQEFAIKTGAKIVCYLLNYLLSFDWKNWCRDWLLENLFNR